MTDLGKPRTMTDAEPCVIWLSGQSWDRYAGTHRNMATAMSEYSRILWVDPPVSPATRAEHRHGAGRPVKPVLTHVTDRIIRLTPVALPGLSRPGVRATTTILIRAQVKRALRQIGTEPTAVIMCYLGGLLGGWGESVVNVIYGTDDYVAGAELMRMPAGYLRAQERKALASADIVAAVTPQLAMRWAGFGARPLIVPNGCWPITGKGAVPPPDLEDLPGPVVGLTGQLSERIDIDMLFSISDAGYSLLLVGPIDPRWEPARIRDLTSRQTVRYVGPVPSATLRTYLARIDVGITPYRDTPFNRASFPLKNLDYLSAGVPAVSADLPAARWLREDLVACVPEEVADRVLVLASSGPDYLAAIRAMVADGGASARHRVSFAERHSWRRRAQMLAEEVGLLPGASPSNLVRPLPSDTAC